ncbi:iron-siderophore ABC transporter substrate-binding protein [Marinomonas sp. C2222]|uniref:Iron-siderophore ABC transporter substrate-binding protein n=1 Tax=Marinomonas sargassi TaxID=2984494 RepID=A0ABT2YQK0_9GAMM|nr:iron-siderophore ABC transporter substrate-binding protein [Marinomonas sargassi]MCV2402020.1 iron-siderophore ABC transporter substrate-binding protein [Marinomonas sargassi]
MLVLTSNLSTVRKAVSLLTLCFSSMAFADIKIQDSLGEQVFSEVPKRVASLNWELTENVIELGVSPIATADIAGYREWVQRPELPQTTQDIGDRAEPNLEKLAELKPDVILIGAALYSIKSKLEEIAPVVFFHSYQAEHNNAEQVDKAFMSIATLLNKEAEAKQKLATRTQVFAELKTKLDTAFPNGLPKVASMRFANTTSAYVYGDNAMPQYALEAVGIENALSLANTQWGVTQKKLKFLRSVDANVLLYFQPFYEEEKLNASPLWKAMPFVQQNKVASVASTWTYGGAMSLQYLAEAMTDSLLEVANQQ